MKSKSRDLSSTAKALKILMAFVPNNKELGTLELSKNLDLHKSTVSRLLHLLKDYDFVEQHPETKKYTLGRSAARIGNAVFKSVHNNIVGISQSYLHALCQEVGESVALEVFSGTHIFLACQVEGQKHIRFSFAVGEQIPVHVAAGAKAILAFCSPEVVNLCLKNRFVRYTQHTNLSKVEYRKMLEEIRSTKIAYDKGERYEDVHAMATPVFNHEGLPVAAVVIAGPAFRMNPSSLAEMAEALKKTAGKISKRLYVDL